jgi:hypothetical protein
MRPLVLCRLLVAKVISLLSFFISNLLFCVYYLLQLAIQVEYNFWKDHLPLSTDKNNSIPLCVGKLPGKISQA